MKEEFPFQALDWTVQPEGDWERQVWVCDLCTALVTAPRKHITWHRQTKEN